MPLRPHPRWDEDAAASFVCWLLASRVVEARRDVLPIDDVPQLRDVVRANVLVLQVVGVLPGIEYEQRVVFIPTLPWWSYTCVMTSFLPSGSPREDSPAGPPARGRRRRQLRL